MKLRHLIFIIFLACLLISQVSASENISYNNNTTKINFEGVNFTIPQGFGQSKAAENFTDLGSDGKTSFYINELKDEIVITVISDWMGMSLDDLKKDNATKTSVKGHKGWNYTQDKLHYFAYVHKDKGILIGVTNETRLYEVIL